MDNLITIDEIAKALRLSKDHVRKAIVVQPDFPKAIRMPTASGDLAGRPRWKEKEFWEWVNTCQVAS